MKNKIIISTFVLLLSIFSISPVNAASATNKLPSRFTYAWEWVSLHLFTWSATAKVEKLDQYATRRTEEIVTAVQAGKAEVLNNLTQRYAVITQELNQIITQKNIQDKTSLVNKVQADTLTQQKVLSEIRQNLTDEAQKNTVADIQEMAVNQLKNTLAVVTDSNTAENFTNQVVNIWRDPTGTVTASQEKATRVYAAGTTATGNTTGNTANSGVIIDSGQAMINQDGSGNLLIEYAPGTGPNSVTTGSGQKIWKIQLSDGTTADSYTSGSVVIGEASGTATNVIINTVSGGTNGQANVVMGQGTGTASVKVEGGVPTVINNPAGTGSATVEGSNPSVVGNTNSTSSGTVIVNQTP